MFKRILVPTDGSDTAGAAAEAAIAFARAFGSELVTFSVAQPVMALPSVEGAIATSDPGPDVLLEHAQQHVADVSAAAARAGVPCTSETGFGYSPADEIIDAARPARCDLIFMGTHGRRGLSRLIAGSVAQHVLASSPVAVMVYRPPHARS